MLYFFFYFHSTISLCIYAFHVAIFILSIIHCFFPYVLFNNRDSQHDKLSTEDASGIFETNFKPQFRQVPDDLVVREGNSVRLDCIVDGRPIPEFLWYLNGVQVHNDDNHKVSVMTQH